MTDLCTPITELEAKILRGAQLFHLCYIFYQILNYFEKYEKAFKIIFQFIPSKKVQIFFINILKNQFSFILI